MTYQIPPGAYPRNWTSPPDPLPERAVDATVSVRVQIHLEASMDPYDEGEVTEVIQEQLGHIAEFATEKGFCFDLKFHEVHLDEYEICPESWELREERHAS
jgi:hypothetical protein